MRICLLGEFNGNLDEGMRKTSFYIAKELSKYHHVLSIDLRKVISKSFWRSLKDFNPQIVHYIHGASLKSFILLKSISLYCKDAKTVISITRPYFSASKFLISFIKPDLVLVQSDEIEHIFKTLKCKTDFLPFGGVDTEKFNPRLKKIKEKLREKYGVKRDKFVILHAGSIKEGRNVMLLRKLQGKKNQVIVVGATSTGIQRGILHKLEEAGCIVWTNYFEHIEEIHSLSDCYVFPVLPKKDILGRNIANSIEMPLSVIEAMSCNLPVITTKFGALPRAFKEGDGLFFAENENDFSTTLENIKNTNINVNVKTREKALLYSWENIGKKLEEIYSTLIGGKNEK